MIRGSVIGERFRACTFENFEVTDKNQDAVRACKRVAVTGRDGVLLMGEHGVGKTHLLIATAKEYDRLHSRRQNHEPDSADAAELPSASDIIRNAPQANQEPDVAPSLQPEEIEREAHVEYWPILDLLSELRAEIGRGTLEISRRCRECDLLVLDDFGAERTTDFVTEELERIVDWRYRSMIPTAAATNFVSFGGIDNKYGRRIFSRWMGSCMALKIGGVDRRATSGPMLEERGTSSAAG
jgi:DNA replication protein DnaC